MIGEAADGTSGLLAARELEPDLVLLDVQLPDVDGFQVAAELTGGGGGPAVVLTSTHDAADFGARIADCGARGFLPKADFCAQTFDAILASE